MLTAIKPMTLEEFWQLPDPPDGGRYELHDGVPVIVPPAHLSHNKIQRRLSRLLEAAAGPGWVASTEVGFGPLPEHEYRIADIILVSEDRWAKETSKLFRGVPDLVVEVHHLPTRQMNWTRAKLPASRMAGKSFGSCSLFFESCG